MNSKKGKAIGWVFIIFSVILLTVSGYLLYYNLPTEPIKLEFINGIEDESVEYSKSEQFFDNLRYKDRRISYEIERACSSRKIKDVGRALDILESKTIIDFYQNPVGEKVELTISCSDIMPEIEDKGFFIAGEGGPTEVVNVNSSLYGVILSGEISFFREERCDNPNIALHELLHALGFNHNGNPKSILYPTLDCDQLIEESVIEDINRLYSADSLPDLKILEINSTKSGRYLNFNIEVINQGLQDADNVVLSVYADDKFVKDFDLENIEIGTRKFLDVTNLKIARSAELIVFSIDDENLIDELFENNNKARLRLVRQKASGYSILDRL